jgi:hypothetical protein
VLSSNSIDSSAIKQNTEYHVPNLRGKSRSCNGGCTCGRSCAPILLRNGRTLAATLQELRAIGRRGHEKRGVDDGGDTVL